MQAAQAAKEAETAAAAATPAATTEPVAGVVPPVVEKTPEQIAEEAAAAAAIEEAAKPNVDDDLPNFDDFDLDPIALAPKELAGKIQTDAALAAAEPPSDQA